MLPGVTPKVSCIYQRNVSSLRKGGAGPAIGRLKAKMFGVLKVLEMTRLRITMELMTHLDGSTVQPSVKHSLATRSHWISSDAASGSVLLNAFQRLGILRRLPLTNLSKTVRYSLSHLDETRSRIVQMSQVKQKILPKRQLRNKRLPLKK